MPKPLLLQAFEGKNKTVPVWFMRQAGRYLPAYRQLRDKYSLDEMFRNPEMAADVTCLPLDELELDAAIVFADILTLPSLMGIEIHFDSEKGPIITKGIDIENTNDITQAHYVEQTIKLVKERLDGKLPLIGFAGSPFTVLTYLVEGGSSLHLNRMIKFIQRSPELFDRWMKKLTDNTIIYLQRQIACGADAVQLFDTWAGVLRPSDYARWVLPYVKKIFDTIDVPSIYYVKNCHHLLPLMDKTSADFLSVDQTVVLGHDPLLEKTKKGVQGNLYNGLLYADEATLRREVEDVLLGGSRHQRYIFNLSHGVFPDVGVETLKRIVDQVHQFRWKN